MGGYQLGARAAAGNYGSGGGDDDDDDGDDGVGAVASHFGDGDVPEPRSLVRELAAMPRGRSCSGAPTRFLACKASAILYILIRCQQ
jgi:hypothetical protein